MHAPLLQTALLSVLMTHTAVSASETSGLFDNLAHGQAEWNRYCSGSISKSDDLLPHACFAIHDDVTTAAHSSSHDRLGFASASGQDFVVMAPKAGEDSKVEFFASGFWIRVAFSDSLKCASVTVRVPTRNPRGTRKEGEEPALEPYIDGTSCSGADRKTFSL